MKALLIVALLALNGCYTDANGVLTLGYNHEKNAACKQQYGEMAQYNQIADLCMDRRPNPAAAMLWMQMNGMNMNQPPSPRYTAPQITPMPMNRCNSLVIGDQISTTCY